MSVPSPLKPIRMTLLAGAFGALCAVPAVAQDDGRYDNDAYNGAPSEEVIVTAPDIRADSGPTLGQPGRLSLTRNVSYSDLDLRTHDGARELRARVRDTAREICDQLRDAYPVRQQPDQPKCYESAYQAGMMKADAAIRDARYGHYWR